MRKLLILLLVMVLAIPAALAESRNITGGNADRVHLRTAPSKEADSLGLYYTGTGVIAIDQSGGWTFVRIGAVQGWMMTDYLTTVDPAQLGPWQIVDNPHSTWVNLRSEPSMSGGIMTSLNNGTAVHILGETGDGWSYIECGGMKGYVVTDYLSSMEDAESFRRTSILGRTAEQDYIHQYVAPNGQSIYFVAMEREPHITYRDVNFDGVSDLVVFVTMGASNFFTEFFVYDTAAGIYVRAEHLAIDHGLCNYQLYPEHGIVVSHVDNGNAGAAHEYCLFRWEGTNLKLIRQAVSETLTEYSHSSGTYTTTTYTDVLRMTVRDYQSGEDGGTLLWERIISMEDTENRDIFTEEQDALWQGIR